MLSKVCFLVVPTNEFITITTTMSEFPVGIDVEIVGLECANNGRSCPNHTVCGAILYESAMVRIRLVEVNIGSNNEWALAVHFVEESEDGCRVGFLRKHLLKHSYLYNGAYARVEEIFSEHDENTHKRRLYNQNYGLAIAKIVALDPNFNKAKTTAKKRKDNDKSDRNEKEPSKLSLPQRIKK